MRIAFVSDSHGDLVALRSVIADIETRDDVDEVLFGGDMAQGGAQPAEVVDEIRSRRWPSVRGNADDLLIAIADGAPPAKGVPPATFTFGAWSAERLGPERIAFLRSLPMRVERGPFAFGTVVLVHATPWSTEDVVLPDADEEVARRMIREAGGNLLVHGHIHTAYQRRVADEAALVSVGAVSVSNDGDPRPAYTVIDAGATLTAEVRRVECRLEERLAAFDGVGADPGPDRLRAFSEPGPFPVRSRPGEVRVLWP